MVAQVNAEPAQSNVRTNDSLFCVMAAMKPTPLRPMPSMPICAQARRVDNKAKHSRNGLGTAENAARA
eukprot:6176481-Pleurochrysis_carterae.AAC.1